jgi:hypothetical protein
MMTSPKLSQRLWQPKTANAALVHINSLTLVLNVMKTVRHVKEVATMAESRRLFRSNPHDFFAGCVLSGQNRDVLMLWSDDVVRHPSQNSDTTWHASVSTA